MIDTSLFRGTGTALATPFDTNGKIDFNSLKKLIEFNIKGGVEYLVSLGTTGEAVTLNREECQSILDFTLEQVDGRIPVVFGVFGSNNTEIILERLNGYTLDGVSALLAASPYYNKPTQEGIYQHYKVFSENSSLPIIIYNVPGRTSSNIEVETTLRLANNLQNIIGIKEASGNVEQVNSIIKHKPDNFLVISGDDPSALGTIAYGGDGVISVISNAFPEEWSNMIRAGLSSDFGKAAKININLHDLHYWLYRDGNPCGIKAALKIRGIIQEMSVRLPLVPVSDETYKGLQKEMEKILSLQEI
ncbi:4-hydroxy-tetrahydrodipicolinate synthase [Membranihabitans maritimus]|uniref:4-hydroxy-tetrahydrodipicolinate synthase n=1 Tax=Membranihabitans maritimus TaxID=2904244 RepID=UPI001EFFED79|nr:4-hydroxy-tetrahydrodipicolinate synthase [Membranihabitans maritimus]